MRKDARVNILHQNPSKMSQKTSKNMEIS